jgi:adenosylmethionine-8-amino-7-oxononanoate aminotransferase
MKHHEQFPLMPIARGEGVWLVDFEGKRYLDAVSSWWVNLFGHANPRINAALKDQLEKLEHVMLAGFTHEPVVELSERLAKLTGLGHAFYGSDGASAVEIALKMSFHYWRNAGASGKKKFISLEGGYHGETIGALSVTDVAIFRDAYGALLNNNLRVPFPGKNNVEPASTDITEANCLGDSASAGVSLEKMLAEHHQEIAAFIVEPLVQGAAGMRMYPPQYLRDARALCDKYGVHLIADEIMTGFGRTGTMFAYEQAGITPDFVCLSKGLTGGYLPLSCVLTTDAIFGAFYHDDLTRAFLHSHSYTGSALACRAALATLDIFESDDVIEKNCGKAVRYSAHTAAIRQHERVINYRQLGMIWAFDVDAAKPTFAREFFAASLKRGVLLRPIGSTVYFMPPYVIEEDEFAWLVEQTIAALDEVCAP